jgi:hypothetical protein
VQKRFAHDDQALEAVEVSLEDAGCHGVEVERAGRAHLCSRSEDIKLAKASPQPPPHHDRVRLVTREAPAGGGLRQGLKGEPAIVEFDGDPAKVLEQLGGDVQVAAPTPVIESKRERRLPQEVGGTLQALAAHGRQRVQDLTLGRIDLAQEVLGVETTAVKLKTSPLEHGLSAGDRRGLVVKTRGHVTPQRSRTQS